MARKGSQAKPTDAQIAALGRLGRTKWGRAIIRNHASAIISLMMA
jgi:hypothetical protein